MMAILQSAVALLNLFLKVLSFKIQTFSKCFRWHKHDPEAVLCRFISVVF